MGVKGSLAFVAIALLAFLTKTLVVDFRAFEPIKPYSTFTDCKKLDRKLICDYIHYLNFLLIFNNF